MSQKSAKAAEPDTRPQESKLRVIDGIQVYSRMDEEGKPSKLDAIDQDERKIRHIADLLFRRGFGVMRSAAPGRARSSISSRRPGPGRASRPMILLTAGERRTPPVTGRSANQRPQPGDWP